MELLPHLLEHAFEDTIYLVPFLLITYILLELLEHKAGDKAAVLVRKAGIAGPLVGALLGAVPQCGFSAAGSALYASRAITLGTLFAVFLSTSDEMLPLFIAEQVDPAIMLSILGTKVVIGMVMGFAIDGALRLKVRSKVKQEEKALQALGQDKNARISTRAKALMAKIIPFAKSHAALLINPPAPTAIATNTNIAITMVTNMTITMNTTMIMVTIDPIRARALMDTTSQEKSLNSPFLIITATILAAAFPMKRMAGKIS